MAARCRLYYITDCSQFPGDEPARRSALLDKIAEAARAGVDFIQLREKDLSAGELEQLASEAVALIARLRTENRELRTRLLINSRTDVALAAGADGVHLRSDDVSPEDVFEIWKLRGAGEKASGSAVAGATGYLARVRRPTVAVSCHSPADVLRAASEGADFAVFAPVFEKRDRPERPPAGLAALREACQAKLPVFALGGVTLENARSCLEAGAAGVAGIRLFQENRISEVVHALSAL